MNPYVFDQQIMAGAFSRDENHLPGLLEESPPYLSPCIAGVDEAGRGPLAGPVVVAAVILPPDPQISGLRDSKIVPPEQREALYQEIQETAIDVSVAVIEPILIDSLNIYAATMHGMRQAILGLQRKPETVLIDGNQKPYCGLKEMCVVKGDAKSASIMAASIIAKVVRDNIMIEAHNEYPMYGFRQHKGYGCKLHLEALKKYGPCPLHRNSFGPVRKLVEVENLLVR